MKPHDFLSADATRRSHEIQLVRVLPVNPAGHPVGTASQVREALRIEYETFRQAGYVETFEDLRDEYDPYTDASTFLLVNRDGESGVARVIDDSPAGFKTINDITKGRLDQNVPLPKSFDTSKCFEIGTLSIPHQQRHGRVGLLLYGAIVRKSQREGKRYLIASFDDGPKKSFLREFEELWPRGVTRLGEPVDYMGTPTTPVLIDVVEAYAAVRERPAVSAVIEHVRLTQVSADLDLTDQEIQDAAS